MSYNLTAFTTTVSKDIILNCRAGQIQCSIVWESSWIGQADMHTYIMV